MSDRKRLIVGGVVGVGLMVGVAGLVIGAGVAKGDPGAIARHSVYVESR